MKVGDKVIYRSWLGRGRWYRVAMVERLAKTAGLVDPEGFYVSNRADVNDILPFDPTLWDRLSRLTDEAKELEHQRARIFEHQARLWREALAPGA